MKRLVICCDGTWNSPWQRSPTNVVRFYNQLARHSADGVEQVPYYGKGVGMEPRERLRGGMFGYGLSKAVRNAYAWVVEHFEPGDEIYAVGFSRGAFTARSTVGLIRKAGVLRREEAGRVNAAYDLYRRSDLRPADAEAVAWREAHSHETRIRFVGVWDTVGALGVPVSGFKAFDRFNQRFAFHDTQLSSSVDAAFHALSVDERREPYRPALWQPQEGVRREAPEQVVEQAWFAGCHSDVGGGNTDRELAELTLWWMQQRAREHGLAFDGAASSRDRSWSAGRIHQSRRLLFRLFDAFDRPLGTTDPAHERLASSVLERFESDPSYRPPQLRSYLERGGATTQL